MSNFRSLEVVGRGEWNTMNRALGHFWAHTGKIGSRKLPEDGEMTVKLPSRHMIRNSNLGGLRPSTLSIDQGGSPQYWGRGSKTQLRLGEKNEKERLEGEGFIDITLAWLRWQAVVHTACLSVINTLPVFWWLLLIYAYVMEHNNETYFYF